MKKIIFALILFNIIEGNTQENIEVISSGTSGDAVLKIEADTDNNNENDNSWIEMMQDGAAIGAYIGFNSNWGGSAPDNLFRIGTRYSNVDNYDALVIKGPNRYVGIGTSNPDEKLHVNGTTTITANIGVPISSHWNTGAHTFELQNNDAGDVVMSFHRGGYSSASIKHSSLGGLDFSGSGAYDSKHMFLKSNGFLGIGTTTPSSQFDIRTSDNKGILLNFNNESAITFRPNNGNSIFHLSHGHDNKLHLSHGSTVGSIKFMTFVNSGKIGIGTTTPDSKLTVAGNIHAQEVKVTVNAGADFVFDDDYNLPSLEELEKFLKANKHLPEIASEKEMQENGLQLAEMNIKLLQKIEELTLYTIAQDKQLKSQANINQELKERLLKLEQLLLNQK